MLTRHEHDVSTPQLPNVE